MKGTVSKGLVIGAIVIALIVVMVVGGAAMNKASGPEIDRTPPPADFLDPSKAPKGAR